MKTGILLIIVGASVGTALCIWTAVHYAGFIIDALGKI